MVILFGCIGCEEYWESGDEDTTTYNNSVDVDGDNNIVSIGDNNDIIVNTNTNTNTNTNNIE
jgi:hypothetical protein